MKYTSVRAFAKALNRDHTTVGRWLAHEEWTLPRRPPWELWDGDLAHRWAAETMDSDRGWRGADRGILAPGPLALTGDEVGRKLNVFLAWAEPVWGMLTLNDLKWLAKIWN